MYVQLRRHMLYYYVRLQLESRNLDSEREGPFAFFFFFFSGLTCKACASNREAALWGSWQNLNT
jgi:hypothetical protein